MPKLVTAGSQSTDMYQWILATPGGTVLMLAVSLFVCLAAIMVLFRSEPIRIKTQESDVLSKCMLLAMALLNGIFFFVCICNLKVVLHK